MSIPLGSILWDLPPVLAYRVGQTLTATVIVRNGTTNVQRYSLQSVVAQGTTIIEKKLLPVSDSDEFNVFPDDIVQIIGPLSSPIDNATLTLELVEAVSGQIIDNIQISLVPAIGNASSSNITLVGTSSDVLRSTSIGSTTAFAVPSSTSALGTLADPSMLNTLLGMVMVMMMMQVMMSTMADVDDENVEKISVSDYPEARKRSKSNYKL